MSRFDVTTLGEAMLRLSVPAGMRLETARQLDLYPAGAEANVVAALARLERRCGWVSALPGSALGRLVTNELRQAGVDVTAVHYSATGRMGSYFIEFATPPRPTQVVYDRANSCFTQLKLEQIDWEYLLDTRLLHLTGITPPLSPGCLELVTEAMRRVRERGTAVSFDVNYRQRLWSPEGAAATLLPLMQQVNLLFCSQRDAVALFNCQGTPEEVIAQLAAQTAAQHIVVSLADEGVIGWHEQHTWRQAAPPVQMIDRIGAGDALAAGVIHGWLEGDFVAGLRYGVTMAALALSQYGDMVVTNPAELIALASQSGGGMIR